MKNYHDFCADITKQLFCLIENGGLLKWSQEWRVQSPITLPHGTSGVYSGMNLFKLLHAQYVAGFASAQWLTYLQVKKLGGNIRKGAHGTKILFYKLVETTDDQDDRLVCVRLYTVFNQEQTTLGAVVRHTGQNMSIASLIDQHKIVVEHYGSRAYYNPQEDVIVMPKPSMFTNEKAYDTTLLHEIVHWSGSANRLDRDSLRQYGASNVMRAEEELVAEIGSVFLATQFDSIGNLENHASYILDWKKLLSTKNVAAAVSAAGKAFHWLIEEKVA